MLDLDSLTEEEIDNELEINNASLYSLEREVRNHSRKEAKYHRWYSQALKEVDKITMEYETVVAEVLNEIVAREEEEKKLSPNMLDNLRKVAERTQLPLDKRVRVVKRKLISAKETANILHGLVTAWSSRGYRIGELVRLGELIQLPEFSVHSSDGKSKREQFASAEDRLSEAGEAIDGGGE